MSKPGNARIHLSVLPPAFELRDDVPPTRGDCPAERPCPHVHCKWNTWMVTGLDSPGRRHVDGDLPRSTIKPTWMLNNCGADIADMVEHGVEVTSKEIAEVCGVTDRQLRRIQRSGLQKLGLAGIDARKTAAVLRQLLGGGR